MCLDIVKPIDQLKSKKFYYKLFMKNEDNSYTFPHRTFKDITGKTIPSVNLGSTNYAVADPPYLMADCQAGVYYRNGFHCFVNREEALKVCSFYNKDSIGKSVIIKIQIGSINAYGLQNMGSTAKKQECIVVDSITLISEVNK